MKLVPPHASEPVVCETQSFHVVQDPKHSPHSYHYTAWMKEDVRSLIEITRELTQELLALKQRLLDQSAIQPDAIVYLHFPPNYWRLHVHFVASNHQFDAPPHEVFLLADIILHLDTDPDYFLKTARIDLLGGDGGRTGELPAAVHHTWLL